MTRPRKCSQRVVAWAEATGTAFEDLAILSHGVGGAFELGNQWITATSLPETAPAWQDLSRVLAVGANIELFGCNVAAPGSDGQNLLELAGIRHPRGGLCIDRHHGRRRQLDARSGFGRHESRGAPRFVGAIEYGAAGQLWRSARHDRRRYHVVVRHGIRRGEQPDVLAHGQQRQRQHLDRRRHVHHGGANEPVASVTYGGQSLTLIGSARLPMPNPRKSGTCWPPRSARPTSS